MLKGNVGYMAPEYLRFQELDRRSGPVLSRRGPVRASIARAAVRRRRHRHRRAANRRRAAPDIFEVRDVPPELAALLFELLAKDREVRPATALAVAKRLEQIAADLAAIEGPFDVAAFMDSELPAARRELGARNRSRPGGAACHGRGASRGECGVRQSRRGRPEWRRARAPGSARNRGRRGCCGDRGGSMLAASRLSRRPGGETAAFAPGHAELWAGGWHNCALRGGGELAVLGEQRARTAR